MAQQQHEHHQQESIFLQQQLSGDQLQRWGSLTSVTSTCSSDLNDIGLPPLPLRQRSMSSPADAPVPHPAALHQQQQYLLACSMPEQQYLLEQQHSLQTCLSMGDSGSLEALVYEAGLRHPGSCMPAADQDAQMLDGDTQPAWGSLSPSVLATAAAFARARRSQQVLSTLHSSGSMSSTSSGSSSGSQPLATQSSGRSERSASYPGGGSSSCCTVAMELCSSERSLPRMDSSLLRCQSVAASPKYPEAARLSAQELVVLSKLKAILSDKEQLASIEKQLRHKLLDEQVARAAAAAAGGSPRAAAAAAAMKQASTLLHQQQRSHSFSGCSLQSPQARAPQPSPSVGSPAAAVAAAAASAGGGGSPCSNRHQHSSTAAALLAAAADPALVLEYARAHKQQQQQHQACMAAVAAATTAGSPRACPQSGGQQKHASRKHGLNPAAMAKLRQLMALQQQQIQVQQELLALL